MAFIPLPVLTVDIVDFSLKSGKEQMDAIKVLIEILGKAIPEDQRHPSAYIWSPAGDGGAITFLDDIHAALPTAVSMGRLVSQHNSSLPPRATPLQIRIGLHSGSVSKEIDFDDRENVWGPGINVSTRVASLARPNQILASADFCEAAELGTRSGGEVTPIGKLWAKHGKAIELYNIYIDGVGVPTSEAEEWYRLFNHPLELAISTYEAVAKDVAKEGPAFRAAVLAKRLLDLKPQSEQATQIIESISEKRHSPAIGKPALHDVFFSKLSPEALLHFFKNAEFVDFKKGDTIYEEGKKADSMMMIVSGEVTLSIRGQRVPIRDKNSQKEKEIIFHEGDVTGEMGLFNPERTRTATLKASKSTTALVLDYRFLRTIEGITEKGNRIRKEIQDRIWRFYRDRRIENQIFSHDLLRDLSDNQRFKLLDSSEFLPNRPDEKIRLEVKDLWEYWTIVVSGSILVYTKENRRIESKTGDCLGPIRLFVTEPPYFKVEVRPNTHLVRLPWEVINRSLNTSRRFRHKCLIEGDEARLRLQGEF